MRIGNHLLKRTHSSKKEKSTPRPRGLGLKLWPNKKEAFTFRKGRNIGNLYQGLYTKADICIMT